MKKYEKSLLNTIQGEYKPQNDEPLRNIKNEMGQLRHVVGNPMFKSEIGLNVTKNYFLNQQPILPAALPAALQQPLPVPFLGLTDYYGGYLNSFKILPLNSNWNLLSAITYQVSNELLDPVLYRTPAFWDAIGGTWLVVAGNNIQINEGVLASIVKNNFWQAGHRYLITMRIGSPTPNGNGWVHPPFDGNIFTSATYLRTSYYQTVTYEFVPTTNDLYIGSQAIPLATNCFIYDVSIKEIIGYELFSAEPSIGIIGYNKNVYLSPNVVKGDLVITYVAPVFNTYVNDYGSTVGFYDFYVCEIIIHSNSVAYGTFLNSFVSDLCVCNQLRYFVPAGNINQLINPIIFGYQSLFGKLSTDSVDPRMYQTPDEFQNHIADIPVKFPIDKNLILGFQLDYLCQHIYMTFFIEKVEPLTLRNKYI